MRIIEGVNLYALDMEWSNMRGLVQPLELAVLPIDNDGKCFFRYIRPVDIKRLSENLCRLLRINKEKIQKAPGFRRVIHNLQEYIPHEPEVDNIAVIWHEETKEYFLNACKEYRVRNPFREIVSLKNILLRVQNRNGIINSFERLLHEYNIDFSKASLHNSGYDAIQLKALFRGMKEKTALYKPHVELVSNTGSKVIHTADCRYCSNIADDRRKAFDMDDLYTGYRICKVCGKHVHRWISAPTEEEKRFVEIKESIQNISAKDQFLDSSVAAMSIHFGFEYVIGTGCIEILTSCGRWKIYHDGKNITRVYHGNHFGKNSRKGVHEQKGMSGTLYEVLNSISKHDNKLAGNKIKSKPQKQKLLMEKKVIHHVKRNYYLEKDEWEEYYDN